METPGYCLTIELVAEVTKSSEARKGFGIIFKHLVNKISNILPGRGFEKCLGVNIAFLPASRVQT